MRHPYSPLDKLPFYKSSAAFLRKALSGRIESSAGERKMLQNFTKVKQKNESKSEVLFENKKKQNVKHYYIKRKKRNERVRAHTTSRRKTLLSRRKSFFVFGDLISFPCGVSATDDAKIEPPTSTHEKSCEFHFRFRFQPFSHDEMEKSRKGSCCKKTIKIGNN